MDNNYDNYTVDELRALARNRGLRGYSRLRRQELIHFLNLGGRPILDRNIENINVPVLQPTIAQPLPPTSRQRPTRQPTTSVNDLLRSLENVRVEQPRISPELNALKKEIKSIFDKLDKIKVIKNRSALKNYATEHKIEGIPVDTPQEFLELVQPTIVKLLSNMRGFRVKLNLQCLMKRGEGLNEEKVEVNFSSSSEDGYEIILEGTDILEVYLEMIERILENFVNFLMKGSGWTFDSVVHLKLHSVIYEPLKASGWIPLPDWIANKKACIDMKSENDECFTYCILRFLNPKDKNPQRVDSDLKSKKNSLNMKGIKYPVSLIDIDKFERQNPTISVNVFGIVEGKEKIKRIRAIKRLKENHVNLLYIKDEEKSHYVSIKDGKFNALMRAQVSDNSNVWYCMLCMNHFGSEKLLEKHMERCEDHDGVDLIMPKFDPKNPEEILIKFENYCRKIMVPFIVIADFECILQKIETQQESNTIETQKHIPVSYNYLICSFDSEIMKPVLRGYVGKDAEKHFIDTLTKDAKQLFNEFYKNPVEMEKLTEDKVKKHKNEVKCWICGGKFTRKNYKVIDHCHFTGNYRGAAHNECNLKAKIPDFIPVFFHNLCGYDAHIFIKYLGKTNGRIDCIPNTEEKYISFTTHLKVGNANLKLRFLDSFKFLSSSLDKIATNLKDPDFINLKDYLKEHRGGYTEEKLHLLRRKGVFPYEWLDSFDKLEETQLPPIEAFYSSLNGEHIKPEDLTHALKVWDVFECKNIKDFLRLYNETDVLLLADIMENFRFSLHKKFGLDPAWYYTLPGYGWDVMLKISKIELEKLTDINMLNFLEETKRGGVCMVSVRYAKANNKYMGDEYDPTKPSKYLFYIDKNSRYPWAMSKPLPVGDFKWMTDEELDNWENYPCFLEVDLEYPKELHDLHNEMPLATERLKVSKVEKLIPNLNDKKRYLVHYEALKTYIRLGLKIKKIYCGIKIKESTDIKKYIDKCVKLRTQAKKDKNNFEADLWKMMMNSVFGKTMENIRNRVNIELVKGENSERFKKLTAKHNFHNHTIFDENLVAVHMKKTWIKYDKPLYLGVSILDISKTTMLLDYYEYFKNKFGEDKVYMCYTDTDSYVLVIETEDLYEDLKEDADKLFDFSNYPPNHPLYSEKNRNVLGLFKDEMEGDLLTEFVSPGAKTYAMKKMVLRKDKNGNGIADENGMWIYDPPVKKDKDGNMVYNEKTETKKCKGVKKSVIKNELRFDTYKNCLDTGEDFCVNMGGIKSKLHELTTIRMNKRALSFEDDKRVILLDGSYRTLSHGHYRISELTEEERKMYEA